MKLPRWVKFWSSQRVQPDIRLTEDGRILDEEIPVFKGAMMSDETMEAWALDSVNLVADGKRGLCAVITERNLAPLPLWQDGPKKWDEKTLTAVAEETTDSVQQKIARKGNADRRFWIFLCATVVIGFCILASFFMSAYDQGNIKLPWGKQVDKTTIVVPNPTSGGR